MSYLMIENAGVADTRSFYMLGVSTARADETKIGQFGSGAKMGTLLLIREGLDPHIYCGTDRLKFTTKPNSMCGTDYNEVWLSIGNGKATKRDYSLETGAMDWDCPSMALREYVSNAIDNTSDLESVTIKEVDKPRAKSGTTRVFVPMNEVVRKFRREIKSLFLHFGSNLNQTIIPKQTLGTARIYRKGVFVRELSKSSGPALFDYNIDDLAIDECRNANNSSCKTAATYALSQSREHVKTMFLRFVNGQATDHIFEDTMNEYDFCYDVAWWKEVWDEVGGNSVIVSAGGSDIIVDPLRRKGFHVVIVPSGWYARMRYNGIPTGVENLSKAENSGCEILPPSTELVECVKHVWEWFKDFNLTENKDLPNIMMFSKAMDAGTELGGYYENGTVYLSVENVTNTKVIFEELAHYVTGATDNSRDFQDFAFKMVSRMGKLIYS